MIQTAQANARAAQVEQQAAAAQRGAAVVAATQAAATKPKPAPLMRAGRALGTGGFTSKFQPEPFDGGEAKMEGLEACVLSWPSRFYEAHMAQVFGLIYAHRMSTELYHVLVMQMWGLSPKLVPEREGFEGSLRGSRVTA